MSSNAIKSAVGGLALVGAMVFSICCSDDDGSGKTAAKTLRLEEIAVQSAGQDNNPEIVRFIPGTNDKAIFVASGVNKLGVITYSEAGFTVNLHSAPASEADPTGVYSTLTSIDVDPTGTYVAVVRLDTRCPPAGDLTKGTVIFARIDAPSVSVKEVDVGYAPDSVSFSRDGHWLVVANEADPERGGDAASGCAPPNQGSVTVVDLSQGIAQATVVADITQGLLPDDQLPEGVKVSPDNNTVVVALQNSDELMIFGLDTVGQEGFAPTFVALPEDSGPDGLAIAPDGAFVLASNEVGDGFSVVSLPAGTILANYTIRGSGDVPSSYARDERGSNKQHEPEECAVFDLEGHRFGVFALQESHAVIGYDLDDPANPKFSDITQVGLGWSEETDGREGSSVGSEGLSYKDGYIFIASEREGSISLLRATYE